MLKYTMDVSEGSIWLRTTPPRAALMQPYFVTEAGLFYANGGFTTSRSSKESCLIFFTLDGAGLVEQKGESCILTKGDALLIDCRKPQSYRTLTETNNSNIFWDHFWIHTDGPGVMAMTPYLMPDGKLTPVHLSLSSKEIFENLLRKLPEETTESAFSCGMYVHRILNRMVRAVLSNSSDLKNEHKRIIENAADYIRLNYKEELDLKMLLNEANMSKSYFLRLFRQYMGTTPYNFLLNYRITQAKELLDITDMPVWEVAQNVGFANESNFSTRFSKITGESFKNNTG